MKSQLITEAIQAFKLTLNPESKFYNQDIIEFKNAISKKSAQDIKDHINRLKSYSSKYFEKKVNKELSKLDKQGMFNIKNFSPDNCLD